jgi:hypothetical protein
VRRDHFDWKIVEGPDDLITQVGRALLGITDWSIAGHAPVGVRPANEGDAEFLELCWCDWEYRPVGVMLSDFGADQRAIIGGAFGHFADPRLRRAAKAYLDWKDEVGGDVEELIATYGAVGDEDWWSRVADALIEKVDAIRCQKNARKKKKFEASYGNATFVAEFGKVIKQYGRKIPAGFLLHMTKFPAPPAGNISDALLLAWGRLGKKIKGGGGVSAETLGVSHGDGDLAFAGSVICYSARPGNLGNIGGDHACRATITDYCCCGLSCCRSRASRRCAEH